MKNRYFSEEEEKRIIEEIRLAEQKTSGEIRLHVESRTWRKTMKRAALVFLKLKMNKTELRNGVLIYLAFKSRKFAIVADKGINEKVPDNFWEDVKTEMQPYFRKNAVCDGVCLAIKHIGEKLVKYFPVADDDVNELSDEISYGD